MPVSTISSRAFNQEVSKAKKLSENGPVYITDRGKSVYVLRRWCFGARDCMFLIKGLKMMR